MGRDGSIVDAVHKKQKASDDSYASRIRQQEDLVRVWQQKLQEVQQKAQQEPSQQNKDELAKTTATFNVVSAKLKDLKLERSEQAAAIIRQGFDSISQKYQPAMQNI